MWPKWCRRHGKISPLRSEIFGTRKLGVTRSDSKWRRVFTTDRGKFRPRNPAKIQTLQSAQCRPFLHTPTAKDQLSSERTQVSPMLKFRVFWRLCGGMPTRWRRKNLSTKNLHSGKSTRRVSQIGEPRKRMRRIYCEELERKWRFAQWKLTNDSLRTRTAERRCIDTLILPPFHCFSYPLTNLPRWMREWIVETMDGSRTMNIFAMTIMRTLSWRWIIITSRNPWVMWWIRLMEHMALIRPCSRESKRQRSIQLSRFMVSSIDRQYRGLQLQLTARLHVSVYCHLNVFFLTTVSCL